MCHAPGNMNRLESFLNVDHKARANTLIFATGSGFALGILGELWGGLAFSTSALIAMTVSVVTVWYSAWSYKKRRVRAEREQYKLPSFRFATSMVVLLCILLVGPYLMGSILGFRIQTIIKEPNAKDRAAKLVRAFKVAAITNTKLPEDVIDETSGPWWRTKSDMKTSGKNTRAPRDGA